MLYNTIHLPVCNRSRGIEKEEQKVNKHVDSMGIGFP